MTNELTQFLKNFEARFIPLSKETALAAFNASISGKAEDYQKSTDLQIRLTKIFTNKEDFATLKRIRESKLIDDPMLKRQLDVLYNHYLGKITMRNY